MPQPANTPIAPVEALGHVARRLQRLPRALDEVAVLRIHDRRVARADAEEARRRTSRRRRARRCGARSSGRSSVAARHARRRAARRASRVDEAVLAGRDAPPELVDVGCAGEPAGHADDGDVGLGGLGRRRPRPVIGHHPPRRSPPRRASARRRIAPAVACRSARRRRAAAAARGAGALQRAEVGGERAHGREAEDVGERERAPVGVASGGGTP